MSGTAAAILMTSCSTCGIIAIKSGGINLAYTGRDGLLPMQIDYLNVGL